MIGFAVRCVKPMVDRGQRRHGTLCDRAVTDTAPEDADHGVDAKRGERHGLHESHLLVLPEEFSRELVGIRAAEILFYVFCAVVAVVAVVFTIVQYGSNDETALWLINQGREYVEAPRWAAIGIVVVMVVFAYNVVGTAFATRKITGITAVLMIDLVPLVVLYLIGVRLNDQMGAIFRLGERAAPSVNCDSGEKAQAAENA
jgi:hypothetical protein